MANKRKKSSNGNVTLRLRGTYFKVKVTHLKGLAALGGFRSAVLEREYKLSLDNLVGDLQSTPVIEVDRNPMMFHFILDYLVLGTLHFPHSLCTDVIQCELKFWGVEVSQLAPCCYSRITKAEETRKTTESVKEKWKKLNTKGVVPEEAQNKKGRLNRLRGKLFYFFEDPNSSYAAKVWAIAAILVVLLSVSLLMIQTMHIVRTPDFEMVQLGTNLTRGEGLYKYYMDNSKHDSWLTYVDTPCTVILSIEYIARFTVSYGKWQFFIHPMNILDLLAVLPNWVNIFLEIVQIVLNESHTLLQYMAVAMSFFGLLRMLRIFKIMMLNKQLRILFLAMTHSLQELCILASLILVFATIFGSLGFYIELNKDTFPNIFYAVWWAVITMTTVGYGDFYPTSTFGYILGIVCSLCGIIVIAVATTVIVNRVLSTNAAVESYEQSVAKMKPKDSESNLEEDINHENSSGNKVFPALAV